MNKILFIKHWQLFLLVVLTGFWVSPSPLKEIINMISIITFTIWAYAIVVQGQEKLQKFGYCKNLIFFKSNIVLIATTMTVSLFISDELESTIMVIFLILFSIYLLFAIFYCIYLVAKTIKSVEMNKKAGFKDYNGYLLLIFFFFIGVWVLQPKVNRIFSDDC